MGISAEESEQVRSGAVGLAPPRAGGRIPSIPDGAESDGPAEGSPAPPAEPAFGASQRELGVVFSAPPSGAGPHRDALQMPRLQRLALYSADWGKIVALGPETSLGHSSVVRPVRRQVVASGRTREAPDASVRVSVSAQRAFGARFSV